MISPDDTTRLIKMSNGLEDSDEEHEFGSKQPKGLIRVLIDTPYLSVFLFCIPFGILSGHFDLGWGGAVVFTLNFFSILPMAWLIGKSTEDLASYTNQTVGGLLSASFGNIVEMLLCIAGIRYGEIAVVQCTLVGSIISNLLLVMGTSFVFGGCYHTQQHFSKTGAGAQSSLLLLSVLALMLPTLYAIIMSNDDDDAVTEISRWSSILLLVTYLQYLYFQLVTHKELFEHEEDEDEEAEMSARVAFLTLAICTGLTTICSEYLIATITPAILCWNISKEFLGIIILPIIGNAAEHYTAITAAGKNKMDLSLSVAVGSSCQMALLVTPFTVIAGWFIGQNMTLDFHPFQVAVLLLSVLIVNSSLSDGQSNWLEGSMLITAYICIAMIYFFENTTNGKTLD